MTASSPVTMEDLVNGLKFSYYNGVEFSVVLDDGYYKLGSDNETFNTVNISSDGLTITFGVYSAPGAEFTGFTFNA